MTVPTADNRSLSSNVNQEIGHIVVVRYMTIHYIITGILGGVLLMLIAIAAYFVKRKYLKPRAVCRRRLFSESQQNSFYYSSESDADRTLYNGQEMVQLSSFGQNLATSSPLINRSVL